MEERLNTIESLSEVIKTSLKIGYEENIIDIEKVVESVQGKVEIDASVEISSLIKKTDAFIIKVSDKLTEKQRRLWIAFELGNLFIYMGYKFDESRFESFKDGATYKSENNFRNENSILFAMAFLAPKKLFISKMKENYDGDGIYNIPSVAEYFNLEEEVIVIRGRNLGLLAKGDK